MRPLLRPRLIAALLAVTGLLVSSRDASADWVARYFLFDRAIWSADSRSLGVIGRYRNVTSGESFEDTLLVDVGSGAITCLSPSVTRFVLNRDGSHVLALGRWGLHDYELATGVTRPVRYQDAFSPNEIVAFSYSRESDAAIVIRCSDEYPESSGVYAYPIAGGEERLLVSDPLCGPQSLNYWQSHRRDVSPTALSLPRLQKPTVFPNFPGTLWHFVTGTTPGVAVWGNGPIEADTLCVGCRVEFNSVPPSGSSVLVSTAPEDIGDVVSPGDLWLLKPAEPAIHLGRGRFESAAWRDSTSALVLARPGELRVANTIEGTLTPLSMSLVPDWIRNATRTPATVWSARIEETIHEDHASARTAAIELGSRDNRGYAVDPAEDRSGYRLSIGAFSDSAGAAAAAKALGKSGVTGPITIVRRPVSEMLGQFDFAAVESPDGRHQLFFRSHPHMFQPYLASEVWIRSLPDGRPRLLIRSMSSF
jgi:hypothetical protein